MKANSKMVHELIDLIKDEKFTIARVSRLSGVPASTISDLVNHPEKVEKMSLTNAGKLTFTMRLIEASEDFSEHGNRAAIVYDNEDHDVWSDLSLTDDEWVSYDSDEVVTLVHKSEWVAQSGNDDSKIKPEELLEVINKFNNTKNDHDRYRWHEISWRYE